MMYRSEKGIYFVLLEVTSGVDNEYGLGLPIIPGLNYGNLHLFRRKFKSSILLK